MMSMIMRNLFRKQLPKSSPGSSSSYASAVSFASNFSSFTGADIGIAKEKVDCVVIGAGVVGIAVARELSSRNREVLVVESATTFGTGTSSRNSEVIHAGIYYPPNSLKASFCVRGRNLMYEYCKEHEIPHKQIGKLIVATKSSDIHKLIDLMNRGIENGVDDLRLIDGQDATRIEPELQCTKALWSPVSGIVDSHSLMLSLVGEAESQGTIFSYNSTIIGGSIENNQIYLHVSQSQALENLGESSNINPELILVPNLVINCAGLSATSLAKLLRGVRNGDIFPDSYFARGCYFSLSNSKDPPFKHLIYPIPENGGLGVHVTLDLNGQLKFGPDVEWIDGVDCNSSFLNKYDYSVCADRAKKFYPEIRKYYPALKDESLEPAYSGIRPKLSGPRQASVDFMIQGEEVHGIHGLVNLFGIESPGLTSCLAIADHISTRYSKSSS